MSFRYTVLMLTGEETKVVGETNHGWNLGRVIGDLLARPDCVTVAIRDNERARNVPRHVSPQVGTSEQPTGP